MGPIQALLIDSDGHFLTTARMLFEKLGMRLETSVSPEEAEGSGRLQRADLVFLDMEGGDPLRVLGALLGEQPAREVVLLGDQEHMPLVVEGLRRGAADYLVKPVEMRDLLCKAEEGFERVLHRRERIKKARLSIAGQ